MSIWYLSENSGPDKPAEIDKTSSKIFNYIRKDFIEVPAQEDEDDIMSCFSSAHWQYQEAKIRKSDWASFLRDNIYWLVVDRKLTKEKQEAAE